jgi:predicted ester cyclase
VFADDDVRQDLRPTQAASGAAGQALIAEQRRAFPDLELQVDLVLGDDDLVAARWTAWGTRIPAPAVMSLRLAGGRRSPA